MSAITTHVLDVSQGKPARDVPIILEFCYDDSPGCDRWQVIGSGVTDNDGRLRTLLPSDALFRTGTYRLTFDTNTYFANHNIQAFYPTVTVAFRVTDATAHYHVPLLLSPFGYSTYRGS